MIYKRETLIFHFSHHMSEAKRNIGNGGALNPLKTPPLKEVLCLKINVLWTLFRGGLGNLLTNKRDKGT